jgi:hypothetical protein
MTDRVKLFDKQLSLATLQEQIGTTESLLGPLKALDHSPDKTAATYKVGARPKPVVELRKKAGNSVPDGYVKVCEGTVWILSQLQEIIAIRKTSV